MTKSTRRTLLKTAALAAAPALAQSPKRPNILMVLTDDHSVPHVGCYGDNVVRTPNLDQFAAEGMRFGRAYTTSSQCSPSRASIMTGRFPQRIHMTRLATPLPPEHRTFLEELRDGGYFTGVAGRWHHMDGRSRPRPWLKEIYERHGLQTMKKRVDFLAAGGQRQALTEFRAFLDERPQEKPFALQISFNDPHRRWEKNEYSDSYDPAEVEIPPYLPDLPEVRNDLTRYYGEITRADRDFGRILEELEGRGLKDDTLVVFMGDNGHAFPRGKMSLYQPGWHVPLIIRWPGRVKPGSSTDELISGVDFFPTFLEAAGVRPTHKVEGRSFLRLLEGRRHESRRYVYSCRGWHDDLDLIRAICTKTHSLVYNCRPETSATFPDSSRDTILPAIRREADAGRLPPKLRTALLQRPRPLFELFDLRNDPHEFENLAGSPEHKEIEFELKSALNEWMEVNYDYLPPPFVFSQDLDGDPVAPL